MYGNKKKLWDFSSLKNACLDLSRGSSPVRLLLVPSNPETRYSQVPSSINSLADNPEETNVSKRRVRKTTTLARKRNSLSGKSVTTVRVKLPTNQHCLQETRCPVNFNITSVNDIIKHSVKGLVKQMACDNSVAGQETSLSIDPNDYMLRLVGTDMHLFGDGLLIESEHVKEMYEFRKKTKGELLFQLLKIKKAAQRVLKTGGYECMIPRFYAFSYGFMRDIIYNQMLTPQRSKLHGRCLKYLKAKLSGAQGTNSIQHILKDRHDLISRFG